MKIKNYIYMVSNAWHEPKIAVKIMSDALKETQILKNQPGNPKGPNTDHLKKYFAKLCCVNSWMAKTSNIWAKSRTKICKAWRILPLTCKGLSSQRKTRNFSCFFSFNEKIDCVTAVIFHMYFLFLKFLAIRILLLQNLENFEGFVGEKWQECFFYT
jgi:hypothetical protein